MPIPSTKPVGCAGGRAGREEKGVNKKERLFNEYSSCFKTEWRKRHTLSTDKKERLFNEHSSCFKTEWRKRHTLSTDPFDAYTCSERHVVLHCTLIHLNHVRGMYVVANAITCLKHAHQLDRCAERGAAATRTNWTRPTAVHAWTRPAAVHKCKTLTLPRNPCPLLWRCSATPPYG